MAHRLMLLAVVSLAVPAWAQLADPTRPPQLPGAPAEGSPGAATAAVAAPTGLQSIILAKDGKTRPAALINGQVVQLGGKIGEARLVKVADDHVVLLSAEGRETLQLTPGVEKTMKVGAGTTAKPIGMNAVKGEKKK